MQRAMALAAGQFVDLSLAHAGQADTLQHLVDLAGNLALGHARAAQAIAYVGLDIHHREQRQMLEHHVHRSLVRRHVQNRAALDRDIARGGFEESGDHPHDRRLATARGAKDGKERPGRHRERDVVDRQRITKAARQGGAFQVGGHGNSV